VPEIARSSTTADLTAHHVASELLSRHQEIVTRLARIRRRAITELRSQGLSDAQVGSALGLTRGRIAQLHSASRALEQSFFGGASITITTPLRAAPGLDRPLVAQEDAEAAALLARVLDGVDIDTKSDHVSPAGEIDLTPDGLIAICGPKSSPTMHQIIGTDPVFDYSPDAAGRWRLVDRGTGDEYASACMRSARSAPSPTSPTVTTSASCMAPSGPAGSRW
jgi:transcriptional regulator with XRE-family HTH domain